MNRTNLARAITWVREAGAEHFAMNAWHAIVFDPDLMRFPIRVSSLRELQIALKCEHYCQTTGCIAGTIQARAAATEQERGMAASGFAREYLSLDFPASDLLFRDARPYGRERLNDVTAEDAVRGLIAFHNFDDDSAHYVASKYYDDIEQRALWAWTAEEFPRIPAAERL